MSSKPPSRPRFPIRWKLVLVAALLAVVPLSAVGYRLMDVNADAVEVLCRDLQLAVADDVGRTVEGALGEAEDGLHVVGRVLTDSELDPDSRVPVALALVEGHEGLDHVAVYDGSGAIIDVIREAAVEGISPPEALDEALRRTAAADNVAFGDAVRSAGGPRVPVVVPLRGRGDVTGFALSLVSLEPVQDRVEVLAEARFEGRQDSLFVVDGQGRILAHPDFERARRLESASEEPVLSGLGSLASEEGLGRTTTYSDPQGHTVVGSVARVPDRPWLVAVQVPERIAYASIAEMRLAVGVTVLLAIVLALGVGWILAQRITAPLARLTAFAADLSARRFEQRVKVATSDELSTLGDAMSRAAEELEQSEARLAEEAAIRSDLGRYLPDELVEKVVRREQDLALGGTRQTVTVLFADVVAFTPLSEKLRPEEVVTILNELFTILTGIVFRHDGTVDKFIGDCVMALWGAPSPQEDHAARALAAAEEMLAWLEMGNATWQERFGVTVRLAVGINTGEAVVGNVGSESRMEYTAIGDAVNVAARLEAVARPQQILVTSATREAAGEGFDFVDAGSHTLAGREEPLQLYEVRT